MSVKTLLLKMYNDNRNSISFKGNTEKEHAEWKVNAKKELETYLKLNELKKYMKNNEPVKVSEEYTKSFKRIKYEVEIFENVKMGYYVLEPHKANGRVIMVLHGHGSDGKNTLAGVVRENAVQHYKKFNYTYGIKFAEKGYTAYIPDLCGAGERKEINRDSKESACDEMNFTANAFGFNLQGIILSELIRLNDIIIKDGFNDIMSCGFSGGGLFSLLLATLDDRIKYVVSSGYFHSYEATIIESNFCGCNYVPEIWKRFDICDYASLIAPRKLAVETGSEDPLNIDASDVVECVKKIYDMYGGGFTYKKCEGGHKWYGSLYDTIEEWYK